MTPFLAYVSFACGVVLAVWTGYFAVSWRVNTWVPIDELPLTLAVVGSLGLLFAYTGVAYGDVPKIRALIEMSDKWYYAAATICAFGAVAMAIGGSAALLVFWGTYELLKPLKWDLATRLPVAIVVGGVIGSSVFRLTVTRGSAVLVGRR